MIAILVNFFKKFFNASLIFLLFFSQIRIYAPPSEKEILKIIECAKVLCNKDRLCSVYEKIIDQTLDSEKKKELNQTLKKIRNLMKELEDLPTTSSTLDQLKILNSIMQCAFFKGEYVKQSKENPLSDDEEKSLNEVGFNQEFRPNFYENMPQVVVILGGLDQRLIIRIEYIFNYLLSIKQDEINPFVIILATGERNLFPKEEKFYIDQGINTEEKLAKYLFEERLRKEKYQAIKKMIDDRFITVDYVNGKKPDTSTRANTSTNIVKLDKWVVNAITTGKIAPIQPVKIMLVSNNPFIHHQRMQTEFTLFFSSIQYEIIAIGENSGGNLRDAFARYVHVTLDFLKELECKTATIEPNALEEEKSTIITIPDNSKTRQNDLTKYSIIAFVTLAATAFTYICATVEIKEISLHSYEYFCNNFQRLFKMLFVMSLFTTATFSYYLVSYYIRQQSFDV